MNVLIKIVPTNRPLDRGVSAAWGSGGKGRNIVQVNGVERKLSASVCEAYLKSGGIFSRLAPTLTAVTLCNVCTYTRRVYVEQSPFEMFSKAEMKGTANPLRYSRIDGVV